MATLQDLWKRGTTAPMLSAIPIGGFAVDTTNKKLYSSDGSGIFEIGAAQDMSGYLPLTGGTLSGTLYSSASILLDNNVSYRARTADGTAEDIFRVGTTDVLVLNSAQLNAQFQGSVLFPNVVPQTDGLQGTDPSELTRKDYVDGEITTLANGAVADNTTLANTKLASLTAGDSSVTITGTATEPIIVANVPDPGDTLPDQTGKAGNELASDGTAEFWSPIRLNPNTIATSYSMEVGVSGMMTSGVTIADTISVTIPDGSVLSIV